ncbi:MAG: hypothetical protein AMXMBFR61_04240 [Fimbriimonadales bacterium]
MTGALSYGLAYGADGAVAGLDDGVYEWTYAYDDENRLKEVRRNGQVVYSCVYDAFGRPAVETLNGVTRYLVWEGDELLLEVGTNGAVAVRHVWGAGGYQGYFRNEGSTPTRLALRDGLGHVRGLMNMSKVVTDRYVFDAYGNDVAPGLHNTAEGNSLRFRWNGSCAYRTLPGTNVIHVGARHYSAQLRRWLQTEPAGITAGNPNMHRYCYGNPVSAVDPNGRYTIFVHGSWSNTERWATEFVAQAKRQCLEKTGHFMFGWSGWPIIGELRQAASELPDFIESVWRRHGKSEPIYLFAHSHGGNIALLASQILKERGHEAGIILLVAFGTPWGPMHPGIGKEGTLIEPSDLVYRVYNVFSRGDAVQWAAGERIPSFASKLEKCGRWVNVELPGGWFSGLRHTDLGSPADLTFLPNPLR